MAFAPFKRVSEPELGVRKKEKYRVGSERLLAYILHQAAELLIQDTCKDFGLQESA